ncbi:MAG: TonB-dependent siderophore receptor, partial [Gammaproteobacteria bacterium]
MTTAFADETNRYLFQIAPQPLDSALRAFSEVTGVQLSYPGELSAGRQGAGLSGSFTRAQALDKLLAGTGLGYRYVTEDAVTLTRPDPLAELVARAGIRPDYAQATEPEPEKPKVPVKESDEGPTTLPEMTVTASPLDATSYNVPNATTATKTDTPIFDTPVSVQVVPQQVLRDQQAIRLRDALKNVSGVTDDNLLGGYREFFNIRGFSTDRRQYRDGFLNEETTFSLANAERIEVLKGPASVLYGRLEPGGLINIVTKRPLQEPYYSLQQQFGSFDTYRTTADATGPITADGSLTYRFNLEYLDQDNFRDFLSTDRIFLAPSLTWRPSERTQIDLDFMYQDEDAFIDNGIPAIGNRPAPIPITRNLGEPDDGTTAHNEFYWTALSLSHAITDQWNLRARFHSQTGDGFYSNGTVITELDEATGDAKRSVGLTDEKTDTYFGTVDITGKFSTLGLDHTLLLGADYYYGDYRSVGRFFPPVPANDINIFNPVYGRASIGGVQSLRNVPPNSSFKLEDEWYGIYLQDQVAIGERWHLLAGFRYDWAEALEVCCPPPPANPDEGIKTEDSEF